MSIGVCGALDEDTDEGAVEEGGGGGGPARDGCISCVLDMRQSAEEGVIGAEDAGAEGAQTVLPPPVLADCLSRIFMVPRKVQADAQ